MQLFYEILPVFLFFLAFKFAGIYVATMVGIVTTLLQVLLTRLATKKWDKKQVITLAVFVTFGGMTLYFHDPIFVKWKPTIVFWIFAIAILISQAFAKKPLMERMLEGVLENKATVPKSVWFKINIVWALFFATLGGVNLYIAYHYSNDAWVNFKFYGVSGILLVFSVIQALYLVRFVETDTKTNASN
jgi:intracellular septation protein